MGRFLVPKLTHVRVKPIWKMLKENKKRGTALNFDEFVQFIERLPRVFVGSHAMSNKLDTAWTASNIERLFLPLLKNVIKDNQAQTVGELSLRWPPRDSTHSTQPDSGILR